MLQTVLGMYLNVQSRSDLIGSLELQFNPVPVNSVMAIQQTIAGELNAAFTTPEIVAPHREFQYLLKENHHSIQLLPVFITAIQPTFSLDPRIVSATGPGITLPLFPLVIDIDAYFNILVGLIDSWLHPRMVQLNPGLAQRFNATGLSPILRPNICCNNPTASTTNTYRMVQSLSRATMQSRLFGSNYFPIDLAASIATLPNNASQRYIIAEYEENMAGLAAGTYNSISYKSMTAFTSDPTTEFRMLPSSLNNAVDIDYIAKSITPTADTLLNCAGDTFNPKTLSLQPSTSQRDDCWPMSHTLQAVVPASYSGSACVMGNNTLALIQWLMETNSLSESVITNGAVRVTDLENIDAAVTAVLNNIRCDGETMLITLPIIWSLSSGIASFAYAAAAIGWTLIIATYIFMMVKRGTTVFRSASVPSMSLILAGISILLAGAVALVQTPTTGTCGAVLWFGTLGFTLTFAPLFMKTWRIYKIFDRKALHVIKISNKKLNALIGLLVGFDLLVLSIWQSTHPLQPVLISHVDNSRLHESTQCQAPAESMPLIVITVVTKSILILFGALMGFTTRKVATTFNESQTVAWAIYNFIFATGIIVPIMIIVKAMEDSYIILQLFLVLWIAYATLGLLFGPKITHIIFGDETAHQAENSSSRISSNGFSFISAVGLSRQVLAKYIQALEIQLQAAKTRMREMVGATGTASGGSYGNKTSSINAESGVNNSTIRDTPNPAAGRSASRVFSHPAEKYQSTGLTTTKANGNSITNSVAPSPSHGLRNRPSMTENSTNNNNNNNNNDISHLSGRRSSGVGLAPSRATSPKHDTLVGGSSGSGSGFASPSSRALGSNDVRVTPSPTITSSSAAITAALSRSPSQLQQSPSNSNLIAMSNVNPHPLTTPIDRLLASNLSSRSTTSTMNDDHHHHENMVQPLHNKNGRSSSVSFTDNDKTRQIQAQ